MRCSDVASRATDYSEGALLPLTRWRARRHLSSCGPCRTYVAQLQLTARALPALPAGPVNAAQEAAALAVFRQWRAQGAPTEPEVAALADVGVVPAGLTGVVIATGFATALTLIFARHPLPMGIAWLQGALLAVVACGLMVLARRRGLLAALLSILSAAAPAFVASHGSLAPATGVLCVLHELSIAAVPLVALVLFHRTAGLSRAALVGIAAAGALAGDAALHVTCSAASSVLHVLVFHVGGVVIAAALTGAVAGRLLRVDPETT
jgi:hypothetical protein